MNEDKAEQIEKRIDVILKRLEEVTGAIESVASAALLRTKLIENFLNQLELSKKEFEDIVTKISEIKKGMIE